MIHHIIITTTGAATACGIPVDVFMPRRGRSINFAGSHTMSTHEFFCTVDEAQASCLQCHQPVRKPLRDVLHRDVEAAPSTPKRFERAQ